MSDLNFEIQVLNEEINEMQIRLAHYMYMHCEVQDNALKMLREALQEKQYRMLALFEERDKANELSKHQ